jgi:hypothetical protein
MKTDHCVGRSYDTKHCDAQNNDTQHYYAQHKETHTHSLCYSKLNAIQHNDTQHSETQHKDTRDTQHNGTDCDTYIMAFIAMTQSKTTLSIMTNNALTNRKKTPHHNDIQHNNT